MHECLRALRNGVLPAGGLLLIAGCIGACAPTASVRLGRWPTDDTDVDLQEKLLVRDAAWTQVEPMAHGGCFLSAVLLGRDPIATLPQTRWKVRRQFLLALRTTDVAPSGDERPRKAQVVQGWLIGQRTCQGALLAMDFQQDLKGLSVQLARLDAETIGMWFSLPCPDVPTLGAEKRLHGFLRLRRDAWRQQEIQHTVHAALRPGTPATQPASKPAPRPATQPAPKPATKPAPPVKPPAEPATKPAPKPATKPAPKPAAKPATRPATQPATPPATRPATAATTAPAATRPKPRGS